MRKYRDSQYAGARAQMVHLIQKRGVSTPKILSALGAVKRHHFIPEPWLSTSSPYGDHPCAIGHDQTISQPYIVAYMTNWLELDSKDTVLEIGTGCGYQAAVLSLMCKTVYSVERIPALAESAARILADEGVNNVRILCGDGYEGWREYAPYDAIIVTCAPEETPLKLLEQLRTGGRMILPVGLVRQRLVLITRTRDGFRQDPDIPVRFVPMISDG